MPLLDLIAEQAAHSRVCLASFVDKRVSRVRSKWGRQTCLSAGKRAVTLQLVRSRGLPWPAPHAPVIQVPVRQFGVEIITPRFVQKCHNDGKHVHVWTINEPTEMERLLRLGVDGIVTDHPERLRKVMEKLGVWV